MSSHHQNGNANGNETRTRQARMQTEQALRASKLRYRVLNAELKVFS
jgi:hypothetical protein